MRAVRNYVPKAAGLGRDKNLSLRRCGSRDVSCPGLGWNYGPGNLFNEEAPIPEPQFGTNTMILTDLTETINDILKEL
jgi:hypothetical protein